MRAAKDIDGNYIVWHMFFVDEKHHPLALIENPKTGELKTTYAQWITFTDFPWRDLDLTGRSSLDTPAE